MKFVIWDECHTILIEKEREREGESWEGFPFSIEKGEKNADPAKSLFND